VLAVMNSKSLRTFIEELQSIEYSMPGEQFNLSVKYRDDESVYMGWPMPRGEYVTETGLRDPGLGSGPIEFSRIQFVAVNVSPRKGALTAEYQQKIAALRSRVESLSQVVCDQSGITFRNS
jgi:hypothetical protein